MKRLSLAALASVASLSLSSCLQNETTIHLNKDGSGTLVEQTTLGGQLMAMLDQLSALGGEQGLDPVKEMLSEAKAKAKAQKMGEGVTFDKAEPVTVGSGKGAKVTYRFSDINQLKVIPGDGMSDLSPMPSEASQGEKGAPVTFTYGGGKLTIKMPDPVKGAGAPAGGPDMKDMASNPQAEAAMKEMMGDMKMSFKIVVDSGIAETDASHRDGNTVTLMEMEMGKLLDSADGFKKLTSVDQNDPVAAMEAMKDLPGIKMETKKSVSIELK